MGPVPAVSKVLLRPDADQVKFFDCGLLGPEKDRLRQRKRVHQRHPHESQGAARKPSGAEVRTDRDQERETAKAEQKQPVSLEVGQIALAPLTLIEKQVSALPLLQAGEIEGDRLPGLRTGQGCLA